MTTEPELCPGCGLGTDPVDGPSHAYIGASAGCWQRYGELLAGGPGGELVVDTYAAQHPGVEQRRSVQSVAVHLMVLCAVLERGHEGDLVQLRRQVLAGDRAWSWLALQPPIGTVTVDDVLAGDSTPDEWAVDVWEAWAPHHGTVGTWLDAATSA